MRAIEDILESKEFNEMFNIEQEKKEIEESGWTYKEIRELAKLKMEKPTEK